MFKEKYFLESGSFTNVSVQILRKVYLKRSFLSSEGYCWYARVVSIVKVIVALMTLRGELLLLYKL